MKVFYNLILYYIINYMRKYFADVSLERRFSRNFIHSLMSRYLIMSISCILPYVTYFKDKAEKLTL